VLHSRSIVLTLLGAALVGCGSEATAPARSLAVASAAVSGVDAAALLDIANERLADAHAAYRVGYMEYVTTDVGDHAAGQIVFAKDVGNKQLTAHWVGGDPRRPSAL